MGLLPPDVFLNEVLLIPCHGDIELLIICLMASFCKDIARGQLSEISKSPNREWLKKEFENLWSKSKDIIKDWNEIKDEIKE